MGDIVSTGGDCGGDIVSPCTNIESVRVDRGRGESDSVSGERVDRG